MKKCWLFSSLLLLAVGLSGCGSRVEDPTDDPQPSEPYRLGDSTEINLADWLALPRAKLDEMAGVTQDRLETAFKINNRGDKDAFPLLPDLHMPVTIPVLSKVKYSQALGVSLPPYLKEGQKDPDLALHLARHGDVEAALKLAPENKQLLEQIEACRTERNYPVEWTRLAALTLLEAELKLATAEVEGASELVLLHKQLLALLDARSAAGPLGADLLPVGLRALRDSVEAWRSPSFKQALLADDIEQALKEWGKPPAQEPVLRPGLSRSVVAQLFSDGGSGQVLAAHTENGLLRVLDLGNVPVIGLGSSKLGKEVEGVVAFFDEKDLLSEVWYIYRSRIGELFPATSNLAYHRIEQNAAAGPVEKVEGMSRQSYTAGAVTYNFTMTPPSVLALGVLLRVADARAKPASCRLPANPLDLGVVNLNRTYEGIREELTPGTIFGEPLKFDKADFLSQLKVPFGEAKPARASFTRAKNANLFDSLTLQWDPTDNMSSRAWPRLLLPLWAAYGPCRLAGGDQGLNLVWEQGTTRVNLLLPFNDAESPDLVLSDARGAKEEADRLKAAIALDEQVRKERLEADQALVRLPRFLQWPALALGMTREQASKELPRELKSRPMIKTADGSYSMLFSGTLAAATATPLQLVLRFTPDDKLAQVRIRYKEGPAKISAATPSLLDQLKKSLGAPEPLPAPWLGLWTDMPTVKSNAVYYRWQDDHTILTYQSDAACMEVTLTNCPPDQPRGVTLPRLDVCTRGIEGCQLGQSKEDLVKRWKPGPDSGTADGGLVLFPPTKSPYDLCLVYFENGKASRIMGRHRVVPASANEDFTPELQKVWIADADRLGVVRLMDQMAHPETGQVVVRGYSWNDDRTRIHTFIELSRDGHRMWTEWRDWPIPASKPAPAGKKAPSQGIGVAVSQGDAVTQGVALGYHVMPLRGGLVLPRRGAT